MIDKQAAVALRKQGNTYPSIASIIGCSEAWCKKNLGGVTIESVVIEQGELVKITAIKILEEALQKLREI